MQYWSALPDSVERKYIISGAEANNFILSPGAVIRRQVRVILLLLYGRRHKMGIRKGARQTSFNRGKINFASSIAKCNTWGSHATLSVYAKAL